MNKLYYGDNLDILPDSRASSSLSRKFSQARWSAS